MTDSFVTNSYFLFVPRLRRATSGLVSDRDKKWSDLPVGRFGLFGTPMPLSYKRNRGEGDWKRVRRGADELSPFNGSR